MNLKRSFELLQAYRGVAALMVLLYHASPLFHEALGSNLLVFFGACGYAGVDIFFVLSGFIIFYVHRADLGRPERFKNFITKRLIRVFPAYWLANLVVVPIYFIAPNFGEDRYRDIGCIISSLMLLPQRDHPILTVGWTLTHELLFYAFFALGIAFPGRLTRILAIGWLGLSLLMAPFAGSLAQGNYLLFGFLLSRYNIEFALGCLCAYLALRFRPKFALSFTWLGATTLLTACAFDFLTGGGAEPYRVIAYGLPAALLVVGSVWLEQERPVTVPSVLKFLGDASFSLYLVHLPLLSLAIKLVAGLRVTTVVGSYGAMLFCILLTLFGGIIFHIMVERPLQKILSQTIVKGRKSVQQTT